MLVLTQNSTIRISQKKLGHTYYPITEVIVFTSKIVEKRTSREILEKCVTHSNFVYLENSNFCPKIHDKTLIFDIFSREICQQLRSAKSAKFLRMFIQIFSPIFS